MLQLLTDIFFTFLRIGAFTFGGGYAMIPFIQTEIIEIHRWLAAEEFIDILAIAEMTPGPIAVNSSTFVGYRIAGFWGALVGTIGVILVCVILSTIAARYFFKFKDNRFLKALFKGIRPTVIVLIGYSVFSIGKVALVDIKSVIICLVIFVALYKFKLHPILAVISAGVLGIIFFI